MSIPRFSYDTVSSYYDEWSHVKDDPSISNSYTNVVLLDSIECVIQGVNNYPNESNITYESKEGDHITFSPGANLDGLIIDTIIKIDTDDGQVKTESTMSGYILIIKDGQQIAKVVFDVIMGNSSCKRV